PPAIQPPAMQSEQHQKSLAALGDSRGPCVDVDSQVPEQTYRSPWVSPATLLGRLRRHRDPPDRTRLPSMRTPPSSERHRAVTGYLKCPGGQVTRPHGHVRTPRGTSERLPCIRRRQLDLAQTVSSAPEKFERR